MALILKKGISLIGIQPQYVLACMVTEGVYAEEGKDCVVTSGTEKARGRTPRSHHYKGTAPDFRTSVLPANRRQAVADKIQARLGPDFQVILKSNHIHCEYDPIR